MFKKLGLAAFCLLSCTVALANPITAIGDLKRGSTATIQGTVEKISDEDEFRIADDSGNIQVYIGPNFVPVDVGERITVRGFVDDDLLKEFYARELVRASGEVVQFDRRY
jgi:uncharacterized protein YdeI (BOF family)